MQIKYQDQGYAVMSGSAVLRQIQNDTTPNLDLLIREAIQNSLDAARPGVEKVEVFFDTGSFSTEELSPHLEGITRYLGKLFPGDRRYISVTDKGTTGLTGPVSLSQIKENEYGSLQKLIYQICKPKTKEEKGTGGSWGIGKTVYFRIGCGLVIYYSRIFNEETGRYEERMAAALAEEEGKSRLLKDDPQKGGLAWWGEKDITVSSGNGTIPLIDKPEIQEILDVFSIPRFRGEQTGTVIIIPFVDDKSLLQQTISKPDVEDNMDKRQLVPWWKTTLENYLEVGIQKWYCPRLDNPEFAGPYLEARVNGKKITKHEFLPFFKLIQALYNSTESHPGIYHDCQIHSESIKLRRVFHKDEPVKSAGTFSYLNVTEEDMGMLPPEKELSPYEAIDMEDEDTDRPIVAWVRKPGMIVSYETFRPIHSLNQDSQKEFVAGVFRSKSDTRLVESLTTDEISTMEDYLRACEMADHMKWMDINIKSTPCRIVKNIGAQIKNIFSRAFSVSSEKKVQKRNVPLGIRLAQKLLPPEGLGYFDDRTGGGHGDGGKSGDGQTGSGSSSGRNGGHGGFRMEKIGNPIFRHGQVSLPIRLSFGKETCGVLDIRVSTENEKMSAEKWFKETGTKCPVWLNSLTINHIGKGSKEKKSKKSRKGILHEVIDFSLDEKWVQDIHFTVLHHNVDHQADRIRITVPSDKSYFIEGELNYSVNGFQGILGFVKENQKGLSDQ